MWRKEERLAQVVVELSDGKAAKRTSFVYLGICDTTREPILSLPLGGMICSIEKHDAGKQDLGM